MTPKQQKVVDILNKVLPKEGQDGRWIVKTSFPIGDEMMVEVSSTIETVSDNIHYGVFWVGVRGRVKGEMISRETFVVTKTKVKDYFDLFNMCQIGFII